MWPSEDERIWADGGWLHKMVVVPCGCEVLPGTGVQLSRQGLYQLLDSKIPWKMLRVQIILLLQWGNGVTCFWCFGSTIVRHLSKLLSVDRSTTMHAWPSRRHNAWRLFFLYNLRHLEAAVTCFQGYGSQKRSCLHWVNCKNTCYCAQWSKLLEEGSEVEEKAWDGLYTSDWPSVLKIRRGSKHSQHVCSTLESLGRVEKKPSLSFPFQRPEYMQNTSEHAAGTRNLDSLWWIQDIFSRQLIWSHASGKPVKTPGCVRRRNHHSHWR